MRTRGIAISVAFALGVLAGTTIAPVMATRATVSGSDPWSGSRLSGRSAGPTVPNWCGWSTATRSRRGCISGPGSTMTTRVRLRGIDAPEMRARCAEEQVRAEDARAALAALLAEGEITVLHVGLDKYGGRVLADATTTRTARRVAGDAREGRGPGLRGRPARRLVRRVGVARGPQSALKACHSRAKRVVPPLPFVLPPYPRAIHTGWGASGMLAPATTITRRFQLVLIKPSHYDDDGYVIQWLRSSIPSNSLACVYTLARRCRRAPGARARCRRSTSPRSTRPTPGSASSEIIALIRATTASAWSASSACSRTSFRARSTSRARCARPASRS